MRVRRRVVIPALLLLGAAAGWLLLAEPAQRLLGAGETGLERWVRDQLLAVANDHLRPRLEFASLDYAYPRTVTIEEVRLVGDGVTVLEAASARIELASIPRSGRPVVIGSAVLEQPVLRLVRRPDGTLAGFSNFVHRDGGSVRPDGGSTRLSDVLAIRRLAVVEGEVLYRKPEAPPMRLRPLDFELRHAPREGEAPGHYGFRAETRVGPVARLDVEGGMDFDTAELDLTAARLAADLAPSRYAIFSPQIQQVLSAHEVRGRLEASARGLVTLNDVERIDLEFDGVLTDARLTFGAWQAPVARLAWSGWLRQGVLAIPDMIAEAFGGSATVAVQQHLAHDRTFSLTGQGEDIRLEQALRPDGGETRWSGRIAFEAEARGALADLNGTLHGGGRVSIGDGRLPLVDVFRDVLRIGGERSSRDRADVTFSLGADRANLKDLEVMGGAVGLKGDGALFYDGRLDLLVNAGPLERIEGALGALGDLMGKVTGRLLKYQVTGTLRAPTVKLRPLHLGLGRRQPAEGGTEEPR